MMKHKSSGTILTTGRIRLRTMRDDDEENLYGLFTDREVMKYYPPYKFSSSSSRIVRRRIRPVVRMVPEDLCFIMHATSPFPVIDYGSGRKSQTL